MKKLFLVRHSKSSWSHEGVTDMDRPLKGRGIRDAYNVSKWLREQNEKPGLLMSSPATRAMHTALIFARELNYPFSDIRLEPRLYEADKKKMLEIVRKLPDDYNEVMIFGHNPTITDFVNDFIDHVIDKVPTTGVACLRFESEKWRDISAEGELLFFDYPKKRK